MRPKCDLTFERSDGGTRVTSRGDSNPSGPLSDGLVVVLNVGEPGLASFRLSVDGMESVAGGAQALPSDADPGQAGFSPDGSMVVITARGTDSILTYEVAANGTFGTTRAIASQGPTAYGFGSTSGGTLVVTEAFRAEKGAAAASSYAIVDGSLVPRSASVGNGRSEICWAVVTPDDQFAFTTDFADGAVSSFAIATDGSLSLEDATAGIAVDGMTGLRDEDLSGDGRVPLRYRRRRRLEPLYTATFTTPEAWSVGVAGDGDIEGRGFLLAEGRSNGRLSARYHAANFPRKRGGRGVTTPATVG
jgi:hypothetical protein